MSFARLMLPPPCVQCLSMKMRTDSNHKAIIDPRREKQMGYWSVSQCFSFLHTIPDCVPFVSLSFALSSSLLSKYGFTGIASKCMCFYCHCWCCCCDLITKIANILTAALPLSIHVYIHKGFSLADGCTLADWVHSFFLPAKIHTNRIYTIYIRESIHSYLDNIEEE